MVAARQARQHRSRLGGVGRLAERLAVERDDGVGAERELARARRGARLGERQAEHQRLGRLPGPRRLVGLGRPHLEVDAEPGQQLAAARRGGGEHQPRRRAHG